tara:strand:- start:949 stop:1128 length:180 start_codon:yes stop_codon:yes gene_type:complete
MKNITFMMPKIDLELVCDLFLSYGVFSTTITNVGKEKSYNEMWIDEQVRVNGKFGRIQV